jgi:hypothetical protein
MHLLSMPGGCRLLGGTPRARRGKVGGVRGSIRGLSQAAAARLRWFLLSQHVPGYRPWAVTRTIHRPASPEDWRACQKRWATELGRLGWSEVYRVELQRRKVPHCHGALWVPESIDEDDIAELWIKCTKEQNDSAARENAVVLSPMVMGSAAWLAYLTAHVGKHKAAQLGWLGKQWGVIGRERFELVPTEQVEMGPVAARWFARLLRRWARARYGCRVFTSERGFCRAMDGSVLPALIRAACSFGGESPF